MTQTSSGAKQIAELMHQGQRALGWIEHVAAGAVEPHAISKKPASIAATIELSRLMGVDDGVRALSVRDDRQTRAVQLVPIKATIANRSRVAAAGARIIIHQPAPLGHAVAGERGGMLFSEKPRRITTVEAGIFAAVADGDDVTTTAPAVHRAEVDFDGPSYGMRHEFTRRDLSDYGLETISEEIMESIELGLARACDHALLSAIIAGTPDTFTLAAVAASGLEFAELRALIGSTGTGGAVGQDGTLRAAGVLAELTPSVTGTVIGAFNRFAVAVLDDIRVVVDRRGLHGGLVVTVWADLKAMIPDASKAWVL